MTIKNLLLIFLIGTAYAIRVEIEDGILEGRVVNNKYGEPFHSFEGIPYAEPPLGELRFKAPQPVKPWTGVRDATKIGSVCYQYDMFIVPYQPPKGSEDCLFLNVYSPNVTTEKKYPVMVWIHGGGFVSGRGDEYQPEFLVRKDVILVTINYRLEVLGFLNLNTEDIPGNAGMKDQVAALRWVKKNIKQFGGDPDNITIFGESAGGASVAYHLLSPMSKGLFKRAILQSGTANCWWPNTFEPRERAIKLARHLGCNSTDDNAIYNFLIAQPVEVFVNSRIFVNFAEYAKEAPYMHFAVTSEETYGDAEVFFQGDVYDALRKGIHEDVEIINGYTEDEGVFCFSTGNNNSRIIEQANDFLEFFVPEPLTQHISVVDQMKIGKSMRDYYMKGAMATTKNVDNLVKYFNFEYFMFGILSWQRFVAKHNKNKLYFYKFTCKSERNIAIYASDARDLFQHRQVVSHADDLSYFFPLSTDVDMNSEAFQLVDRATTLWTNFAKYGNPTPDNSLGVLWTPYTLENQEYLELGNHLRMASAPDQEEFAVWENLFQEYYPHVLP